MKSSFFFLLVAVSCSVGPDYKPPENCVTDDWIAPSVEPFSEDDTLVAWWKVFNDPLLEKYIETAAQCNNDLLRAEAAILEARALREVAASKWFPQISADLSALKTYFSKNGPVFAIQPGGGESPSVTTGLPFSLQIPQIQNLFNVLFDASWEIDLFGKTRRTVEAADAYIGSTIEKRNDVLVSLLAEVAKNYMELRSFQCRATLMTENISLLEKSKEIVEVQLAAGYANQLDLEKIEANLSAARAALPEINAEIYREIYSLSILIGSMPETLVDELLPSQSLPSSPKTVALGLRSDLLRRRPDVRQAERQLAVATAAVGIAVASFYPSFTLVGDAGLQSLEVKNLFQAASRTWAYGGDLNMPIFQGGRLVGTLKTAEAECCMIAYKYQETILKALEEAESSIAAYSEDLETEEQWSKNVQNYQNLAELTGMRYEAGLVALLDFLNSERELITSELNLLGSSTETLLDLISLYKALGGGWEPES